MCRKAQEAYQPLLTCFDKGFQCTARPKDRIDILLRGDCVELVQVKVIGAQFFKGLVQFLLRTLCSALSRLAGQKDAVTIGLERRTQHLFCIAVGGCDIKVVDPALIDRHRHVLTGPFWCFVCDGNAAKTDD